MTTVGSNVFSFVMRHSELIRSFAIDKIRRPTYSLTSTAITGFAASRLKLIESNFQHSDIINKNSIILHIGLLNLKLIRKSVNCCTNGMVYVLDMSEALRSRARIRLNPFARKDNVCFVDEQLGLITMPDDSIDVAVHSTSRPFAAGYHSNSVLNISSIKRCLKPKTGVFYGLVPGDVINNPIDACLRVDLIAYMKLLENAGFTSLSAKRINDQLIVVEATK
ncbi:hypothetical protein GJ496_007286 [Pomphorhynchus laevis]|nr:hypothetical protein GJ496_007286 [Pomphorhynchus laevis]